MWAIGLVIGALIGSAHNTPLGALGAIAGLVAGIWAGSWRKSLTRRIDELEARVNGLQRPLSVGGAAQAPAPAVPMMPTAVPEMTIAPPPTVQPAVDGLPPPEAIEAYAPVRKGGRGALAPTRQVAPLAPTMTPAPAADTARFDSLAGDAMAGKPHQPPWLAWIAGGNTLARVGVLLLFIGVGFLVKYAAEHVRVPIEVRLSAVALGGIALLAVGWRLRVSRHAYAMILQGGGVGVLYLTVFGALRLYALIPPAAAFALLVAIAALSAWLALRQDAIAMAAVGIVGGFLAPILASSSSGNHVLLFSYYAVLNAGILAIAWFKAWRILNLLGFAFTFVIAALWGVTSYQPEDFATTEPFLILFFLFYVAIAVFYALRQSLAVRSYVDATLVFGTPLFTAALQSGMVRDMPYGMALSALTLSAVYLALAQFLHAKRSENLRLLVEAFLALGVIFATLAIPLALDARWTSATWALEGAAMLWVGVRQRRLAVRVFGLLLQFGAGVAFASGLTLWVGSPPQSALPLLNSSFIGAVLIGLAGLFSARLLQQRRGDLKQGEQIVAAFLMAWGALWWLSAGWHEIEHWLPRGTRLSALVTLLSLTAAAFVVEQRRGWPAARIPAMLLLPVLLTIALLAITRPGRPLAVWSFEPHLFAHGGYLAWPLAALVVVWLLRASDHDAETRSAGFEFPLELWHAGLLWLLTLVCAHELSWTGMRVGSGEGIWALVPWGLVPAIALGLVTTGVGGASENAAGSAAWPLVTHRRGYLIIGAIPIALALVLWSLITNVASDGDPMPLPYVPLFNPLDITQALVLAALAMWWLRAQRAPEAVGVVRDNAALATVFAAVAFVWINGIALRSIHFWFDVPYTFHDLWRSRLVQAVFSLLWSLMALATMLLAHRRRWRIAWMAGALLLALVVVKLFAVDLSQVGGVERIVSFIGVGLLLLLIGYLAPVPPRRPENAP
jgi:uncharacterized membrane protein